eukprot:1492631-Pleurochrysis_carterae.AAC.2
MAALTKFFVQTPVGGLSFLSGAWREGSPRLTRSGGDLSQSRSRSRDCSHTCLATNALPGGLSTSMLRRISLALKLPSTSFIVKKGRGSLPVAPFMTHSMSRRVLLLSLMRQSDGGAQFFSDKRAAGLRVCRQRMIQASVCVVKLVEYTVKRVA